MKKFLLPYLFIFCIQLFGQDYKPLLDNYNEWQVTSCFFGYTTDKYWTDGDTIGDGINYKILAVLIFLASNLGFISFY